MNENLTPEFSLDSKLQTTNNEEAGKMSSGPSEWVIRNILSYSASLLIVNTAAGDVISMVMN